MSKKRSATSSSSQPESPVFFVDRSLGSRYVPEALRRAGAKVEIHADHFPEDAPDEAWLLVAGQRKWIVLTRDTNIRRRPLEMQALVNSGVRAFVFSRGNMKGEEVAKILASYVPRMTRWAGVRPAPFVATITGSGLRLVHSRR